MIAKELADFLYRGNIPKEQTTVASGGYGIARYVRRELRGYRPGQIDLRVGDAHGLVVAVILHRPFLSVAGTPSCAPGIAPAAAVPSLPSAPRGLVERSATSRRPPAGVRHGGQGAAAPLHNGGRLLFGPKLLIALSCEAETRSGR